jgi:hypothetical protein
MASRFELSLSENYIQSWGIVEAIREIFQNALDQQTVGDGKNNMFINYDATFKKLEIGNKISVLEASSLLLGESSKRGDDTTIGQFGEGYKLALLVLCRLGKEIAIRNWGKRESWFPKLITSRRYGGQRILVIDVERNWFWEEVPENNLVFEISDISPEEYQEIQESNLHLQGKYSFLSTSLGTILLDEPHAGNIYVNGLYVSHVNEIKYGYNIKPAYIKLDRDRKAVTTFDLTWTTSRMWGESGDSRLGDLVRAGSQDVAYLKQTSSFSGSRKYRECCEEIYSDFKVEHGINAYPVTAQEELTEAIERFGTLVKPIIVKEAHRVAIQESVTFKKDVEELPPPIEKVTPQERLEEFYAKAFPYLNDELQAELLEIIEESKEWETE